MDKENKLIENNNTYKNKYGEDSQFESYIYEKCVWCGKDMTNTKDIFVDENDNYVCKSCAEKYGLNVVPCIEY